MAPSEPFDLWGCSQVRESLGLRADSVQQLLERLEAVDADSIYYHSVRCLLRHQVVATAYPDDFANWIASEVREPALAERIAFHSPFDFPGIEEFREHLVGVLDEHVAREPWVGGRVPHSPFRFLRGHLASFPLNVIVHDLGEMREALREIDDSSIYFHTVEAVGRLGKARSDFAAWIDEALGRPDVAQRVAEIDPYVASLAEVRAHLLRVTGDAIGDGR
jgi:hypothetical protein